ARGPMMPRRVEGKRADPAEASRIGIPALYALPAYIFSVYSRLHVRYKLATYLRGLIPSPFMRPPQPEPRKEEVSVLAELLKKTGLGVIEADAIERVAQRLKR